MGTTLDRPVCSNAQHEDKKIQQSIFRPMHRGGGCSSTRLVSGFKFLQSPILANSKGVKLGKKSASRGNPNCPLVAKSTMVSKTEENDDFTSLPDKKSTESSGEEKCSTRTIKESEMETICMEDIWKSKLKSQGWSPRAADRFIANWAPSTIHTYESIIEKLQLFCLDSDSDFPCVNPSTLADFLCSLAENSERPKSTLNTTLAAVMAFAEATGNPSPVTSEIARLVTALIKCETSKPMQRSKVMPIQPFNELFTAWDSNSSLSLEDLRTKTITLLVTAVMLRPSDIAPRSMIMTEDKWQSLVFTTDQIQFDDRGAAKIIFFGIKNDYKRDGFEVHLSPSTEPRLDPVRALKAYIQRTKYVRPSDNPVFISLKKPYSAISAKTVSRILEHAIVLAGLGNQGFSAKNFRPTGTTNAVDAGITPDAVMKVGRWKSRDTFMNHYVHSKPICSCTDNVFKLPRPDGIKGNGHERRDTV